MAGIPQEAWKRRMGWLALLLLLSLPFLLPGHACAQGLEVTLTATPPAI